MKIAYLADHKDQIPIISKWDFDEWGKIKKKSFEEIKKIYRTRAVKDKVPFVLIAFEDNKLIGAISVLKIWAGKLFIDCSFMVKKL